MIFLRGFFWSCQKETSQTPKRKPAANGRRYLRCAPHCRKPFSRTGRRQMPPGAAWRPREASLRSRRWVVGSPSLPYNVGEVAALLCGRRGAEGLRFFGKMSKPPTPLRRLLRRRHLPCTAGEACTLRRTKPEEQKLLGFSTYRSLQTSP